MINHPHYDLVMNIIDHVYNNTKNYYKKPKSVNSDVLVNIIREIIYRDHHINLEPEIIKLIFHTYIDIAHMILASGKFTMVDLPYLGRFYVKYYICSLTPLKYFLRHYIKLNSRYTNRFIHWTIPFILKGGTHATVHQRKEKTRKHLSNGCKTS